MPFSSVCSELVEVRSLWQFRVTEPSIVVTFDQFRADADFNSMRKETIK